MNRFRPVGAVLGALMLSLTAAHFPAVAGSICAPDAVQPGGAIARICMPAPGEYNGRLVVYAHGFQDAGTAVGIPEEQLMSGGLSLPGLVNDLGFAFAMSSFRKTGLAVLEGVEDTLDVVDLFVAQQGVPQKIYVVGVSEGGLIAALLTERHPEIFDAGLAACGPVGNFRALTGYLGDVRVLFEYFFPGLIPGELFDPAPGVAENWPTHFEDVIRPAILAWSARSRLNQLVRVAGLPFDPADYLETVAASVEITLRYSVVNARDVRETLGGNAFDNRFRWYSGSWNDWRLNLHVARRDADPQALAALEPYETSGALERPLITTHTLGDPLVPYDQEVRYRVKTLLNGSPPSNHLNLAAPRYGHCEFTAGDLLLAFGAVLLYAGDLQLISGLGSLLQGQELASLELRASQVGIPYQVAGGSLQVTTSD